MEHRPNRQSQLQAMSFCAGMHAQFLFLHCRILGIVGMARGHLQTDVKAQPPLA